MARLYVENVNNALGRKDYVRAKFSMMSASVELVQLTEMIMHVEQSEKERYTGAWDRLVEGEDFQYFLKHKKPRGHQKFYALLNSRQIGDFMNNFHSANIFSDEIKNVLQTSHTMKNYCPLMNKDYQECFRGLEEQMGALSDFWVPLFYNIYGKCRSLMISNRKSFKKQKAPAKTKGRPSSPDLKEIISKKFDVEACINRLKVLLQGKKGKRVAMVITAAMNLNWFVSKPSFTQLAESCGVCGSKSGYDRQMNVQNFSKTELEAIMKELE